MLDEESGDVELSQQRAYSEVVLTEEKDIDDIDGDDGEEVHDMNDLAVLSFLPSLC